MNEKMIEELKAENEELRRTVGLLSSRIDELDKILGGFLLNLDDKIQQMYSAASR